MLKLNQHRGYNRFVNARDAAIEVLLRNYRLRISELTGKAFTRVLEKIQAKYTGIMNTSSRADLERLEAQIALEFEHLAFNIWMEMVEMRKKVYMLAYAGEAQAIGQTIGVSPQVSLNKTKIDDRALGRLSNGLAPIKSFQLYLDRLRRDLVSCLEYSLAFGDPVEKALGRCYLKFPKQRILSDKKVLKTVRVTEATKPKFSKFGQADGDSAEITVTDRQSVMGFEWDQETWQKAIDDLGSEHVFTDRSPDKFIDMKNPFNDLPIRERIREEEKIYHWEIENEVVQDFVEQVRSGQIDAAKKNGIDDFVWIAILDDRTDHCCEWRSGLLTSEIEERLKSDMSDDDCQAIVPPAHFNCRCTLAPASEDLEAVDNTDTEREFDEWLNQR